MRIVQVAGFYGPRSGGQRTCVDALGAGYRSHGHDRVLVVPGPADRYDMTASGRRIKIRSPILPRSGGYHVLAGRTRLIELLEQLQPDRLEVSDKVHATFLGRWAAASGVPATLLSHERLDGILAPRVPRWFPTRRAADRWNARIGAAYETIVAASAYAAEEFERVGHPVTRIPLGVDLDVFRPDQRNVPCDDGTNDLPHLKLVCVSRLSKEKAPELAIETLRSLVDAGEAATLTMVGAGPMEPELSRRAAGLPVTFTGHLAHPVAVARVLAASDVALACCGVETFGLAVLEALACGTPAVITNSGGAPELAGPGAGLATPPTPDAFAHAAIELASTTDSRNSARARAEEYPWSATVARMLAAHRVERHPVPC